MLLGLSDTSSTWLLSFWIWIITVWAWNTGWLTAPPTVKMQINWFLLSTYSKCHASWGGNKNQEVDGKPFVEPQRCLFIMVQRIMGEQRANKKPLHTHRKIMLFYLFINLFNKYCSKVCYCEMLGARDLEMQINLILAWWNL